MHEDRHNAATVGKVVKITGKMAKVDFGGGTSTQVNVGLVEVIVGDLVLVHEGYAIQVIDRNEAERTLKRWKE